MPIQITREGWLQAYRQERAPTGFFARRFTVKPGGIYTGSKVALDVKRIGENVATVVTKHGAGNENEMNTFTTKEFTPPALFEKFTFTTKQMENRPFGTNPFDAANQEYMLGLASEMMDNFSILGEKVDRHIELQASQILQTGTLTLPDKDGNTAFTLDFKPKAAHFPTVAVAWSNAATCTPLTDLANLFAVIRANGKANPDWVAMDALSLENFLSSTQVKERGDLRYIETMAIRPDALADSGATYYGSVQVGAYRVGIWTYPATYDAPNTGATTPYLAANKVVVGSSASRLDLTFAKPVAPFVTDARLAGMIPGRVSSLDGGFDIHTHAYISQDGREIVGEVQSCPLCIPVAIDSFGCLTTTV